MDFKEEMRFRTKKQHPCGGSTWQVLRVGADIRIRCENCGHLVMVPRGKLTKMVKEVLN